MYELITITSPLYLSYDRRTQLRTYVRRTDFSYHTTYRGCSLLAASLSLRGPGTKKPVFCLGPNQTTPKSSVYSGQALLSMEFTPLMLLITVVEFLIDIAGLRITVSTHVIVLIRGNIRIFRIVFKIDFKWSHRLKTAAEERFK